MAKKPAVDVDALVDAALLAVATADEPPGLSAKWHPNPLFADKKGPNGAAIERLTADAEPLVAVEGKAKAEAVRLTAAGFLRVLPKLPDDRVGPLAKAFTTGLGLDDRVAFLEELVRRTPTAAPELLPELEAAVTAARAEADARIAAAAKRREREEASRAALTQWLALLDRRQQDRLDALRREYEAEGGRATDLPVAAPRPAATEPVAPQTPEEHGFRREVIRRLAAAWREAVELGRDEPARFLEAGIGNVRGVRQVGEPGESVSFDGENHEADEGVSTGAAVRVLRPGWAIDEDDDRRVVILKAKVAR
ncbi:hypothetical protein [Urbifossiella limnaea]|uniref:Nucleotide exchange factor GrpE n=1 Tax=Urbifossiella limnaea TaxID=2528023 RepID=A0A517XRR5_9BACT|nr:hypothetical protein [Urbifossiella limnaea]QDU20173.1 hypothetical protein ETAA1_21180 [Urbifossiella limnaea]